MSFLLDPPLLVASGAAIERAVDDPRAARAAGSATVAAFVGVSLALYLNVDAVASRWPLLGARSGREFMLTSGLAEVDERRITRGQHAAALSLFALYPLWLELGRKAARRRAAGVGAR